MSDAAYAIAREEMIGRFREFHATDYSPGRIDDIKLERLIEAKLEKRSLVRAANQKISSSDLTAYEKSKKPRSFSDVLANASNIEPNLQQPKSICLEKIKDISETETAKASDTIKTQELQIDHLEHPKKSGFLVKVLGILDGPGQRDKLTGTITVKGETFEFVSGGWGSGHLPAGNYTLKAPREVKQQGMVVDGYGFKIELDDKYDQRVGRLRTGLLIHPDGNVPGTKGCIGIVGNREIQQRFFRLAREAIDTEENQFTVSIPRKT